jgi:hypothetical protein
MLKHTQSPWRVDEKDNFAIRSTVEKLHNIDRYVARPQADTQMPIETYIANARLIAAAPDMLKALIELYKWQQTTKFDISLVWMSNTVKLIESVTQQNINELLTNDR